MQYNSQKNQIYLFEVYSCFWQMLTHLCNHHSNWSHKTHQFSPKFSLALRNQYPSPTSRLSLMNKDVEHCFVYILVIIFFCEIFVQILCPLLLQLFVFFLLSCKGSLCILDISPLNFSYCSLPFYLFLATFFKEQKFKISIKSDLSIFYLMVLLFVYNLRSLCLAQ